MILGLVRIGILSSAKLRRNRRIGYVVDGGDRRRASRRRPGHDHDGDDPADAALRRLDLARGSPRTPPGRAPPRRYSDRPMARAAVKAKQAQKKAAQPAKAAPRRQGRRKHAGGGNPNQQLFFMRLRRKAKLAYLVLAVLFAITFAFLGVGSGTNGGLDQLFSGLNIFSSGGNPVSKAQKEIKDHPNVAKGYRDLATAYEGKGDTVNAISALQQYTTQKPKDGGGLERARRVAAQPGAGLPDGLRGGDPGRASWLRRARRSCRPASSGRESARTRSSRRRRRRSTRRCKPSSSRRSSRTRAACRLVPEGRNASAERLERLVPRSGRPPRHRATSRPPSRRTSAT